MLHPPLYHTCVTPVPFAPPFEVSAKLFPQHSAPPPVTDVGAVEQKDRLKISYRNGDYRASLSALRIGELADSGEQSAGFMYLIPSMTTADLSISKNVELGGNKGRVKFVVKNIADERAPLADGYNGFFSDVHSDMGRNYYLELRVDL